jgi:hypothetical protein
MVEGFSWPFVGRIFAGMIAVCVVASCATGAEDDKVVERVDVAQEVLEGPFDPPVGESLTPEGSFDFPSVAGDEEVVAPERILFGEDNQDEVEEARESNGSHDDAVDPDTESPTVDEEQVCPPPLPQVFPPPGLRIEGSHDDEEFEKERQLWWEETMAELYLNYARQLIGLQETIAQSCVSEIGASWRVIERDGEVFFGTEDYRIDRINVVITNSEIEDATNG